MSNGRVLYDAYVTARCLNSFPVYFQLLFCIMGASVALKSGDKVLLRKLDMEDYSTTAKSLRTDKKSSSANHRMNLCRGSRGSKGLGGNLPTISLGAKQNVNRFEVAGAWNTIFKPLGT